MDQALRTAIAPSSRPASMPLRSRCAGGVEVITTRGGFDAVAGEWDRLVARSNDQLFFRHWFLSAWLDHFAPDANLCVLLLRDGDGRLVAGLPLLRRRVHFYGLPLRALCSIGNLHTCRFDLVAEDPQHAAGAFLDRLQQEPGWDVLQLEDVPVNGNARALLGVASTRGLCTGEWPSILSPWLRLPARWEVLQQQLARKERSELRRRRRRLQQRGEVTVERLQAEALPQALEEGLELEARGWKGRNGSAILQEPGAAGFYRALAQSAAARGALALWFLRVDGRAVAFQYDIEDGAGGVDGAGRRLLVLKPAYDETFRDCGPGQLLMEDVLRDAVARGFAELDLLGDTSPAKRTWTAQALPHSWLFVFRGGRGRLAHLLKCRIAPLLRRIRARTREK